MFLRGISISFCLSIIYFEMEQNFLIICSLKYFSELKFLFLNFELNIKRSALGSWSGLLAFTFMAMCIICLYSRKLKQKTLKFLKGYRSKIALLWTSQFLGRYFGNHVAELNCSLETAQKRGKSLRDSLSSSSFVPRFWLYNCSFTRLGCHSPITLAWDFT